jgi:hypothetical protein
MSVEMGLICETCKVYLDVGCQGFSGDQFLWGNDGLMKQLGEMLFEHQGHPLRFDSIETDEVWDGVITPFAADPTYGHRDYSRERP